MNLHRCWLIVTGWFVFYGSTLAVDQSLNVRELTLMGFQEDRKQEGLYWLKDTSVGTAVDLQLFKVDELRPTPSQSEDSDIREATFTNGQLVVFSKAAPGARKGSLSKLETRCDIMLSLYREAAEPTAVDRIPAFATGSRILFQGDSITDGNRGRTADPNHILGHSYAFLIAAAQGAAFPELKLEFLNRGISGNTVLDLEKRWPKDTLELQPDILSILIGVNDQGHGVPFDQYEAVYDQLLTAAQTANPKLKIVLGEPFTLPVGAKKANYETWRAEIGKRQEIVGRLAKKHGAALVHYQRVFDDALQRAPADYWIWDGVHPTYRGHQLMADEWLRVVREFWK